VNPYGSAVFHGGDWWPARAAHQLVNDEKGPWRCWFVHEDLLRDTKNAAVVIRKTPPWKAALPWGDDLFC